MDYDKMKAQTFGVEIEMNHISREKACKAVAQYLGTENTVTHEGGSYDAWTCEMPDGRKWKFMTDGSIRYSAKGTCEMVTPILKYEDMETLKEICRVVRRAGGISNAQQNCGVHIHIGADGHDARSLRNLANIMAAHEELLIKAVAITPSRMGYCKTVDKKFLKEVNSKKPKTMDELKKVWYESQECTIGMNAHYNSSRYHMLNLHATFTKGTVEFRLFEFNNPLEGKKNGIHAGQLMSYIQLCLALSEEAKELKSASPKKVQLENPKYAMRTWLLRLGFIGEEYQTAREFLTKRLEGNAAFRQAI